MKKTHISIILLLFMGVASAAPDQQKITEVKSGKLHEARASWWGFDENDATACLQAAIDSGVKKLIIDNTGHEWTILPVKLRSDLELVLEDGVIVRAKAGAFRQRHDYLLRAREVKNVVIRGEGTAILRMNKQHYQDPQQQYGFSEWRHSLVIFGSENITVSNLTLESSGGDGIYVNSSKNVLIEKVVARDHHRQGISVISAENLTIRDSKFNYTEGTPPSCGIDFEPNNHLDYLINCLVENCEFTNNAGLGIVIPVNHLDSRSAPVSITLRNLKVSDNKSGALAITTTAPGTEPVKGEIKVENCDLNGEVLLSNLSKNGIHVTFSKVTIHHSSEIPLTIASQCEAPVWAHFIDTKITGGSQSAPFRFSSTGEAAPQLTGSIRYGDKVTKLEEWSKSYRIDPNSIAREYTPAMLNLSDLGISGQRTAAAKKHANGFWFRNHFKFYQYANAGEKIELELTAKGVGSGSINGNVELYGPDGELIRKFAIGKEREILSFQASATGIYRFSAQTLSTCVYHISSAHPGFGIDVSSRLDIFGTQGRLYFEVPAGSREFTIKVSGHPREYMDVKLYNQDQQLVNELRKIEMPRYLRATRVPSAENEIWSVDIANMVEDGYIEFGSPLIPVVAFEPRQLLRVKK